MRYAIIVWKDGYPTTTIEGVTSFRFDGPYLIIDTEGGMSVIALSEVRYLGVTNKDEDDEPGQ